MKKTIRALCLALSVLLASASLALMPVAETAPATAESTEVVLYEENFESYGSVASYTDLGWTSGFNGDKVAVSVETLNDSKALKMDDADAWSSLRFVSADQMKGIRSYTVSMDLLLEDLTGIFGFIYNNAVDGNNQQNTGMIQLRKQDGVYYVANAGKNWNSYYCASYEGEGGISNWGGQWAPVAGYLNGQGLIGTAFHLELKIDNVERTCAVYINNTLVNICRNIVVNANGIDFLTQKQISYVDNIRVTGKAYAAATVGEAIYSNAFDAYTEEGSENLLETLGWSNFFTNTNAKFTSTANGSVLYAPAGWSAAEILPAEAMNGIQQYTVSMDITVRGELKNPFGLITNWNAKNGTSWPKNCNFVQIRPGYNADQVDDYVIRSGCYFAGAQKASSDTDVSIGSKTELLGRKINFTVEFDLQSKTVRTYIDGVLMDTYTNANLSVYNSGVCLLAQSGSVEIDNLYVTEGCVMSAIAMTAEGHQRTVAADTTYGLRFISSIKSVENVENVCIKVEAAVGDTVKTFDFPGKTVYTSVTGMENGKETTYYASTYQASYLYCLVIKDIPTDLGTVTYTATPYVTLESGQVVAFAPISFAYTGSALQA